MLDQVNALIEELQSVQVSNQEDLETFRLKFISRKGVVTELFQGLKHAQPEDRRELGKTLNDLKNQAETKFRELIASLENQSHLRSCSDNGPDLTTWWDQSWRYTSA